MFISKKFINNSPYTPWLIWGKVKMKTKKKEKTRENSRSQWGFDPLHIGHIRMFQEAKKLGDKLIVILNNDNWFKIKGKPVFMSHYERKRNY